MKKKWLQLTVGDIRRLIHNSRNYKLTNNNSIIILETGELTNNKDVILKIEVYEDEDF